MSNGALQAVARAVKVATVVLEFLISLTAQSIKIALLIFTEVALAQSTTSASGAPPALLTASIVTVTQLAQ